ncbi:MAG: class I SAM-dependent methyltransferase [Deltaproteobacteria bacterium]|nr:class I SAM-dependent methyltransferase [Deltaproteobacteria bacterium]
MRDPEQQISQVRRMFSRVVPVYDLMNRLLSFREDVRWRRFVSRSLRLAPGDLVLDVACGTGDVALAVADRPEVDLVVGLDLVPPMLVKARRKVTARGQSYRIPLLAGDATRLPFPDHTFAAVTIAFGIRNIPFRVRAMAEMGRVLKPGGRLYVLEFTTPEKPWVRRLYKVYLTGLLPKLGQWIARYGEPYQYLAETILEFPSPSAFREEMRQAGLVAPRSHDLTKGIAWLHVAEKP